MTLLVLGVFIGIPLAFVAVTFVLKARKHGRQAASTCGDVAHPGGTTDPEAWYIGPDLSGRGDEPEWANKSPGMLLHPIVHAEGFAIDFPTEFGSKVDYVMFRHGPLTGKSFIRMRYRVELADGARIYAVAEDGQPSDFRCQMTPAFVREGDDWTTAGKYEAYRWYNIAARYLERGEYEMVVPLNAGWTATQSSTQEGNPSGFREAIDHACCLGFVFGGNDTGIGHGGRATGPARLVVTSYTVE